jgi:lysophospholipase L1-like esterase
MPSYIISAKVVDKYQRSHHKTVAGKVPFWPKHFTMKLYLLSLFFLTLNALPNPSSSSSDKPPYFLLAGDSTTAVQSANGGGWGDGFLTTTLSQGAGGHNYGHNGATTVSFRQGGDWATVLKKVEEVKAKYQPYVTIQFGHNDQKPKANISVEEYTTNLETYVGEVQKAGATPILVTPLARRKFDNSTGVPTVVRSLEEQRIGTIKAARKTGASYIDLNKASTQYLNSIGPFNAHTYNLKADDSTHLNVAGSQVFGGMVAGLIIKEYPQLGTAGFVHVDGKLRTALEKGQYYWP